jgi:hypothetical protein
MAIPRLFVAAGMGVIEALASNGRLFCFRYSGFQAARHNMFIFLSRFVTTGWHQQAFVY